MRAQGTDSDPPLLPQTLAPWALHPATPSEDTCERRGSLN